MPRQLIACLLVLGLALGGTTVSALGRMFNYAFVQAPTAVLDDATPSSITIPSVGANHALVYAEIHAAADTATPTDDQSSTWNTPLSQDGSSHRINLSWLCNTAAATYIIETALGGRTFLVTMVAEYSGIDTGTCADDTSATGNADGADTDPLTGATLTATGAALLVGVGVTNVAIASDNNERREGVSVGGIQMNLGDKRLTGAGDDALTWDFSGTAPTLSLSIMLKEAAGGPTYPAAILQNIPIKGGGLAGWLERFGLWRPIYPPRLVQSVTSRGRR